MSVCVCFVCVFTVFGDVIGIGDMSHVTIVCWCYVTEVMVSIVYFGGSSFGGSLLLLLRFCGGGDVGVGTRNYSFCRKFYPLQIKTACSNFKNHRE